MAGGRLGAVCKGRLEATQEVGAEAAARDLGASTGSGCDFRSNLWPSEAGPAFLCRDARNWSTPAIHSQPLSAALNTRAAMASGGYTPAAYRDSEDGEARCVQGQRASLPRRARQDAIAQSPAGVAELTDMRPARPPACAGRWPHRALTGHRRLHPHAPRQRRPPSLRRSSGWRRQQRW